MYFSTWPSQFSAKLSLWSNCQNCVSLGRHWFSLQCYPNYKSGSDNVVCVNNLMRVNAIYSRLAAIDRLRTCNLEGDNDVANALRSTARCAKRLSGETSSILRFGIEMHAFSSFIVLKPFSQVSLAWVSLKEVKSR